MRKILKKLSISTRSLVFSLVISLIFYVPFMVTVIKGKFRDNTTNEIEQTEQMAEEIKNQLTKNEIHDINKERGYIEYIITTFPNFTNDTIKVFALETEMVNKKSHTPSYIKFSLIEKTANLVAKSNKNRYIYNWGKYSSSIHINEENDHYIYQSTYKIPHYANPDGGQEGKVEHQDTIIIDRDLTELYAKTIYNGLVHGLMTFIFLFVAVLGISHHVQFWQFRLVKRVIDEQERMLMANKYINIGEKYDELLGRISDILIKQHARANDLYVANKNLLQDISHETGSRLAEIKQSVDLIRYYKANGEVDDEKVEQLLSDISTAAMSISSTQSTFIDLAKVENHESISSISCYNVQELINFVVSQATNQYPNMNIVKIDGQLKKTVYLQREHFLLVMRTLLENAVKYSQDSTTVEVGVIDNPKYKGRIAIRVTNWGSYVPEDERNKIFERYYRGTNTRKNQEGSGLGLHIVKKVMELYEGEIRVESDPSGKTSFIIIFKEADESDSAG